MDGSEVAGRLAANVRRARQARGWSLDTLAARSGVSKGVLVAIENARTNPNLATLIRVSDSFGLPLTDLLDAPAGPELQISTPAEQIVVWRGARGGTGRLLTGADRPAGVELWLWRLPPGEEHHSEPHLAGTVEMIFGLRGRLTVTVGDREVSLPASHSLRFAGDCPHAYANRGRHDVEYVGVVLVPPIGRP